MRLPEFARSTTFLWTVTVAGAFVLCIVLMFAFVYWQTAAYVTTRVDGLIGQQLNVIATDPPNRRLDAIDERLRQDPRRVLIAGLFKFDGHRVSGNLESLPIDLKLDGIARNVRIVRLDNRGREEQVVRLVGRSLPNSDILAIGRNIDELAEIVEIVRQALVLGLLPALFLALATGSLLSHRAQKRVEEVNRRAQRIIAGDLRQRLPANNTNDPFDKLAVVVNGMLDEIEQLIQKMSGVGDDIAHDLRTPLTRVRIRLERGRDNAKSLDELRTVVDQSISGLDQSLAIVTALLRIAEIEQSRRLAGFADVSLAELIREAGDLYEPIAEDKGVTLTVDATAQATVRGDRDLLLEAVANLIDNAVKFTPSGGRVSLALVNRGGLSVIRISDTGPGIDQTECKAVVERFYRSEKSRHTQGLGLGLSLVAAIVKLHGFQLSIAAGAGCVVEIACVSPPG